MLLVGDGILESLSKQYKKEMFVLDEISDIRRQCCKRQGMRKGELVLFFLFGVAWGKFMKKKG